jgi:hypothetical protein
VNFDHTGLTGGTHRSDRSDWWNPQVWPVWPNLLILDANICPLFLVKLACQKPFTNIKISWRWWSTMHRPYVKLYMDAIVTETKT